MVINYTWILILHRIGLSHKEVATELQMTYNQVKQTVQDSRVSTKKMTRRPQKLLVDQIDELEEFVRSLREKEEMSFLELSLNLPWWNIRGFTIRSALKKKRVMKDSSLEARPRFLRKLN